EIIHDRWNCLFHPLAGLSPIWANGLAATQAQKISENSTKFFENQSRPGGILSAPGKISDETAKRLKAAFDSGYTGVNAGKVAVVGDGLTFSPLTVAANDAQLVEQLKWTSETVATTYGIPLYKVGLGPMPTSNNLQALNIEYYAQALQGLIEDAETCLDDGLGLDGETIGTEFDVDGLLRMDSATQMDVLDRGKSIMTLDERRARLNLAGIAGGGTVYMQEQDHSIEAIAARDRQLIEAANAPPALPAPEPPVAPDPADPEQRAMRESAVFAEALLEMNKAMGAP
uniref:phage portal protein n=1 Tax=Mangrovicoccus sp. HB161399 TaxID=2720392 RepID=UPI001551B96A